MGEQIFFPDTIGEKLREDTYEQVREQYADPESIPEALLERFLTEGTVRKARPIENFAQEVGRHADQVLVAEMYDEVGLVVSTHQDQVWEAEIILPDVEKPLLVVYKPDSGMNKGTMKQAMENLPEDSSPASHKEVAAYLVSRELAKGEKTNPEENKLSIKDLVMPVVVREDLEYGKGSVRPYIWGQPLDRISNEEQDLLWKDRELLELIAGYDGVINMIDRRDANLIRLTRSENQSLKLIDHSLTFFDPVFSRLFINSLKGPRLSVAYHNDQNPPALKESPLSSEWQNRLFYLVEHQEVLRANLKNLLTEKEIDGIVINAQKMLEYGIYM